MSAHRDESGFRHLLRVRLGVNGPKGRLLHCEKRDGSGKYWKVKLSTGEWAWPEDLVQDGPGELVATCRDCGMRFMCERVDALCQACNELGFGSVQRASEQPERYRLPIGNQYRR